MKRLLLSILILALVASGSATEMHNLGIRNTITFFISDFYEVVTGFHTVPEVGHSGGMYFLAVNKGTNSVYFAPETVSLSTNSFATNRIVAAQGLAQEGEYAGMFELRGGQGAQFWYDATSLRWRLMN